MNGFDTGQKKKTHVQYFEVHLNLFSLRGDEHDLVVSLKGIQRGSFCTTNFVLKQWFSTVTIFYHIYKAIILYYPLCWSNDKINYQYFSYLPEL